MVGDLVLVNCAVFDGRGDHSRPDTGIWVRDG
ncbi:hypothetical protein H4W32_002006 [Actinophytocola algeriensis]|uniref:Uncharacterized protein n=1 Tax=Actinophytocola algeriensis TaxID=1768010 RepID=A0A7W7QC76_9PSEU|nr:hypothetical protein [Actinophytocola algeriensis]MBE1473964.1 hypothetical protein [Actinophytocola algeriensis]